MDKEFILYEEAFALYKLGFNELCFAMWQKNKKLWFCKKNEWITNFVITPNKDTLEFQIKNYPKNVILVDNEYKLINCSNFTAPLYQQAFRWFRKEHNLEYKILRDSYGCRYQITKITDINLRNIDPLNQLSNSAYEEAELACLKKLIEIVKK